MSTLYLHIGFPKTATTFLQDVVFPKATSLSYVSKPTVRLGHREVRFGTRFSYAPALWRDRGTSLLSQILGPEPEGEAPSDVLISDEGFGGGLTGPEPWIPASRPHHDRETGPHSTRTHIEELRKVAGEWGFSQMRVIMGIRRQDEKIASGYAQMSHKVRGASQKNFERWVHRILDPDRGYYEGGGIHHNYYLFWQQVTKAVGAENTLVLPLEHLKEDMGGYLSRLFRFLEIPEEGTDIIASLSEPENLKRNANTSSSKDVWHLKAPMRTGPRFRPGRLFRALGFPHRMPLRWPDFRRGTDIRLTPDLRAYILGVYADENRRLDRALDEVDLRSYGYWPVPKKHGEQNQGQESRDVTPTPPNGEPAVQRIRRQPRRSETAGSETG